jgi:hypothetical protein
MANAALELREMVVAASMNGGNILSAIVRACQDKENGTGEGNGGGDSLQTIIEREALPFLRVAFAGTATGVAVDPGLLCIGGVQVACVHELFVPERSLLEANGSLGAEARSVEEVLLSAYPRGAVYAAAAVALILNLFELLEGIGADGTVNVAASMVSAVVCCTGGAFEKSLVLRECISIVVSAKRSAASVPSRASFDKIVFLEKDMSEDAGLIGVALAIGASVL